MDRGFLSPAELRTFPGRLYYLVMMVFLLVLALLVMFPFVYAFTSGLKGSTEIFESGLRLLPENPQWENYHTAWTEFRIPMLFRNSLVITSVGVVVQLLVSGMAAYSLSRLKPAGSRFITAGFLLTLMIPGMAYLVPLFVTLKDIPVLHLNLLNSYGGLWVVYASNAFTIFVLKSFFDRIPTEIIDSARIDGASPFQVFIYIMLPLSRSILIILSILAFMNIWKDYLLPLLVIQNNPEAQPITVRLFYLADDYGVNLQMAAAFMALLPPLIVAIVLQNYLKEGLTIGGVKG